MRALRVLGLVDGVPGASKNLLLEDPSTGEQFSTRCDDRLMAATRGDLSRFGQLETELESQLRPKEIQARIRAGATVEQLAALAGTSLSRVERYAYPVLLERASVVEKALKARPAIDGITGGASVAETVSATLSARGHDGSMIWDAFKDDDGWVLTLTWTAGRSENRAQWLFHPGPDGGTLSARDEAAAEIVDPALRILRPLRQVRPEAAPQQLLDPTVATTPTDGMHRPSEAASRSAHPAGGKLKSPAARLDAGEPSRPTPAGTRFGRQPLPTSVAAGAGLPGTGGSTAGPAGSVAGALATDMIVTTGNAELVLHAAAVPDRITEDLLVDERAGVTPVAVPVESVRTGTDAADRGVPSGQVSAPSVPSAPSSAVAPARPSVAPAPAGSAPRPTPARASSSVPSAARSAKRGNRPTMPSWEDVLLGTRSDKTGGR